jgi:hypothetical protein
LANDIGFAVTGPFVFDTSDSTSPSVDYNYYEPINLAPGDYETSALMVATISDAPSGNAPAGLDYVQDFQMITSLYSDNDLTDLVSQAYAGQLGFSPSFCPLPGCTNLRSGSTSSPFTVAVAGTYYLDQSFIATVSGVGLNDAITATLPNASGVGSSPIPESGTWGLLAGGMAALLFARRYATKATRAWRDVLFSWGGIATMKRIIHACIWRLALSVAVALPAWATGTAPSPPATYDYTLNLPELQAVAGGGYAEEPGSTFQVEFSWIGPFGSPSGYPGSWSAPGEPMAGFPFSGASLVTEPTVSYIVLTYSDGPDAFVFTLIEPNLFWTQAGVQFFAPEDPPTVGSPGAGWDYVSLVLPPPPPADPGCQNCSVNTGIATPEPGSFGLLASSLGGLILMLRRRK